MTTSTRPGEWHRRARRRYSKEADFASRESGPSPQDRERAVRGRGRREGSWFAGWIRRAEEATKMILLGRRDRS